MKVPGRTLRCVWVCFRDPVSASGTPTPARRDPVPAPQGSGGASSHPAGQRPKGRAAITMTTVPASDNGEGCPALCLPCWLCAEQCPPDNPEDSLMGVCEVKGTDSCEQARPERMDAVAPTPTGEAEGQGLKAGAVTPAEAEGHWPVLTRPPPTSRRCGPRANVPGHRWPGDPAVSGQSPRVSSGPPVWSPGLCVAPVPLAGARPALGVPCWPRVCCPQASGTRPTSQGSRLHTCCPLRLVHHSSPSRDVAVVVTWEADLVQALLATWWPLSRPSAYLESGQPCECSHRLWGRQGDQGRRPRPSARERTAAGRSQPTGRRQRWGPRGPGRGHSTAPGPAPGSAA